MRLSVFYLWYTTTYKYISIYITGYACRSIFTPTLQSGIDRHMIGVIDVFITIPTRRKSVLKAWKYYAHTASQTVSYFPAVVLHGQIAIIVQGPLSPPFMRKNTYLPSHVRLELGMANCVVVSRSQILFSRSGVIAFSISARGAYTESDNSPGREEGLGLATRD